MGRREGHAGKVNASAAPALPHYLGQQARARPTLINASAAGASFAARSVSARAEKFPFRRRVANWTFSVVPALFYRCDRASTSANRSQTTLSDAASCLPLIARPAPIEPRIEVHRARLD